MNFSRTIRLRFVFYTEKKRFFSKKLSKVNVEVWDWKKFHWICISFLFFFLAYEATNQHELLHFRGSETTIIRQRHRLPRLPRLTSKLTEWNCHQWRILSVNDRRHDGNLTDSSRYQCRLPKMKMVTRKILPMSTHLMTDVDVSQWRKKISFR